MKNFLTTTPHDASPDSGMMTAADLLAVAVKDPGETGVSVSDLLERAPILETLKDVVVGVEIHMSHEEWALTNDLFQARKWPVVDGVIGVAQALAVEMQVKAEA